MANSDIPRMLNDIISQQGNAAARADLIFQIKRQVEALEEKIKQLEARNAELEAQLAKPPVREVTPPAREVTLPAREEFFQRRGALFKSKPEGGYLVAAFCPVCRQAMDTPHPSAPYCCARDNWFTDFGRKDIESIIKELP